MPAGLGAGGHCNSAAHLPQPSPGHNLVKSRAHLVGFYNTKTVVQTIRTRKVLILHTKLKKVYETKTESPDSLSSPV